MWIMIQICIFISLIVIAVILPKNIYYTIGGCLYIFTIIQIFMPWLAAIQFIVISVALNIGLSIIEERNNSIKEIFGISSKNAPLKKEFNYAGRHYKIEEFANKYNTTLEQAISVVDLLDAQRKIEWGTEETTDKTTLEALWKIGAEIALKKQESERFNYGAYPQVCFDFKNIITATEFLVSVDNLRLESTMDVNQKGDGYVVKVFNLSKEKYTVLSRIHKVWKRR